jgi:hypothetical protein
MSRPVWNSFRRFLYFVATDGVPRALTIEIGFGLGHIHITQAAHKVASIT